MAQPFRDSTVFQVPSSVSFAAGGTGQPLPRAVLQKMETFFGASFADVRVHVGPQAASIGALAFTMGSDLYFAPGQYSPHSAQGQRLLGHELTHVVQQRAGRVRNPLGSGVAVVQDPALEAEAERMGMRVGTLPPTTAAAQAKMPAGRVGGRPVPQAPSRSLPPGVAQRAKRTYEQLGGKDFGDQGKWDAQASDSDTDMEDNAKGKKIRMPGNKSDSNVTDVVFNSTKRRARRKKGGVYKTKRNKDKTRAMSRVNNSIYGFDKLPDLSADAKAIHDTIPATLNGKANQSFGATTVVCALLRREKGGLRKYCFTNLAGSPGTDLRAEAERLGYHVVQAPQAHAEGEMIQYINMYKVQLVAIGCDKEHCQECSYLMNKYFESKLVSDTRKSNLVFKNYHMPQTLKDAVGETDRPSVVHKWKVKAGKREDARTAYEPTDAQKNTYNGRTLHRITADGDCLFNAVIQAGAYVGTVQQLRNHIAAQIRGGHVDVTTLGQNAEAVAKRIETPGYYYGFAGDIAPELIARTLQINLSIINEDGSVTPLNGGANGNVTLVRVTFPAEHYHLVT